MNFHIDQLLFPISIEILSNKQDLISLIILTFRYYTDTFFYFIIYKIFYVISRSYKFDDCYLFIDILSENILQGI